MGLAFGKVSVSALLLLTLRDTQLRWHKLFLWTMTITLVLLINVASSILILIPCSPPEALGI